MGWIAVSDILGNLSLEKGWPPRCQLFPIQATKLPIGLPYLRNDIKIDPS